MAKYGIATSQYSLSNRLVHTADDFYCQLPYVLSPFPAARREKYWHSRDVVLLHRLLADFYNVTVDELLGREADTINLKFLGETESYLIKKILKMNQLELDKTKAYVMGLTE